MNASTFAFKSSVEAKLDRLSNFLARVPNQISTWFSHEQCLGVYAKRIRWLGSSRNALRLAFDFSTPAFPFTPSSPAIEHARATYSTRLSDWCVSRLSTRNTHPADGSVATVCSTCALKSASVRVGDSVGATTWPH